MKQTGAEINMHCKQQHSLILGQQTLVYDCDTDMLYVSHVQGQSLMTWDVAEMLALRDFLNAVLPAEDNGYERFRPMDSEGDPALVLAFRGIAQLARKMLRLLRALEDSHHQKVAIQTRLLFPLLRQLRAVVNLSEEMATAYLPLENIEAMIHEASSQVVTMQKDHIPTLQKENDA